MFAPKYFGVRYFPVRYFATGDPIPIAPVIRDAIQRALPANTALEILEQHTRPFFIVKMEFAGGVQYLSEAQAVTFESNVYFEGSVKVGSFKWDPDGGQSGTIQVLNENNAASALILNNADICDVAVTIYLVYATGPASNTDPVLYSRGALSGAVLSPVSATLQVVTSKSQTEFVPSQFYTIEEGFNHLPPQGIVVQWAGEKYVLEGLDTA